jgi:hypothetical protein
MRKRCVVRPTTGLLLEGSPVAEPSSGAGRGKGIRMQGSGTSPAGRFRLIIGRRDLERYSDAEIAEATVVRWRAEAQASLYWPRRGQSTLWVPAQWTAWLLMQKAGVPAELIAYVCRADPRTVRKRLGAARWLMLLPAYAASIEALMQGMPRYGAPATRPAKEARCAVPAG